MSLELLAMACCGGCRAICTRLGTAAFSYTNVETLTIRQTLVQILGSGKVEDTRVKEYPNNQRNGRDERRVKLQAP